MKNQAKRKMNCFKSIAIFMTEVREPAGEYPRGRHAMVMRLKEEEYFKTFSVTGPRAAQTPF